MKSLNETATAVFLKLIDGLKQIGNHRTIGNSSFMTVYVEVILIIERNGFVVSVAEPKREFLCYLKSKPRQTSAWESVFSSNW